MKYFAYTRKSTDESGNQVFSLETQKRIVEDVARRDKLQIIQTYTEARSAKKPDNRPLFKTMLTRIRKGHAQGIIVAHIDRLSRNGVESAEIVQLFELGLLKEIRSGSKIYNSVEDILTMDFEFVFASHFSRNLSKRVKEGLETKRLRGEYPTRAPIGYINRDAKIYPDPKYKDYVKLAFTLYAEGTYSLKEITNILYDRGMRTRDGGRKVYKSVVHEILVNPVYYGAIKGKSGLYKGCHEPLISLSLYNQVQDILHGRNKPKKEKHDFLYRGYLKCGVCGCALTATLKKGKHVYYYCTNAKGNCDQNHRYLTETQVTAKVHDLFKPFSAIQGEFAQLAYESYVSDLMNGKTSDMATHSQMELQLQETEGKLRHLLDLLLDKKIDEKTYDEKRKQLADDKTQLELQLRHHKPQDPLLTLEQLEQLKQRATSAYDMFGEDDNDIKLDLLKSVLWNSEWVDGNITSKRYKPLWEILEKGLKSGDISTMYPLPDSNRRFTG
jgi:site-specific DNA recombinase